MVPFQPIADERIASLPSLLMSERMKAPFETIDMTRTFRYLRVREF